MFVDTNFVTGDDILKAARKRAGTLGYKTYGCSNNAPSGVPKDNHFIADTLADVGLGFGNRLSDRPGIADWADCRSSIPGWQPVTDGSIQAGDVLATPSRMPLSWFYGGGQQLAVATGKGTSIGVVDNDRVGESDFGLKDGHNPTVWRSTRLGNANSLDNGINSQQLLGLFDRYSDGPRDGKCRATGTCDITS
ncbi:MAG: hypothetical protein HQL37_13000 [Alphaproteobacteria bacterium]|nr:hypothetical protein [Alphaproteobacteria bacterium]